MIAFSLATQAQNFEWPRATPAEVGLDANRIQNALDRIELGEVGDIRSLLIIKDGKLITEAYFQNGDEMRQIFSITKSIGSALLGVAQFQGADIQTDQPFIDYLPQYANIPNYDQVSQITLHDLLSQRHGYNWDEFAVPYDDVNHPLGQLLNTPEWYLTAAQWPIIQAANTRFAYSTGHSNLMSPILVNRSGMGVYEFAQQALFEPLNITQTHWELYFGEGGMGQGISTFPLGIETLGVGLWMKAIDMAKIGQLYLTGGMWQGQRLLSEDWINASTQAYSDGTTDSHFFSSEFSGYGYQWWTTRFVDAIGRTTDSFYANGTARQYIFVLPELNTVVVSTASDFNYNGPGIGSLMRENILMAFTHASESPIPLTNDMNGAWFQPETSGQGINFEIINQDQIVGFWYTYEPSGGKQRWFLLQGNVIENIGYIDIYTTTDGSFVESEPTEAVLWGTGEIEVYNCLSGLYKFKSDEEQTEGSIPLTRLTVSTGNCLSETADSNLKSSSLQ